MPSRFKYLDLLSVRNRILVFAVLVTLLPSIGLGWIYLSQTEKALLESSQRELLRTVRQVRREFDLWLKERYHDIRALSNSYLLSEGLESYLTTRGDESGGELHGDGTPLAKIESYLSLVHPQFNDYARLVVLDRDGKLLTQSPPRDASIALPDDWQDQLAVKKIIVREVYDSRQNTPFIMAAVPVLSGDGNTLGFLAAEIKLDALAYLMTSFLTRSDLQSGSAELLLVGADGQALLSTKHLQSMSRPEVTHETVLPPHKLEEYTNSRGIPVVGIRTPTSEFDWNLVMEKRREEVFSEAIELRKRTMSGVGVLAALIGVFAYLLSRGIISPLERLSEAAGKVADGDLDVNIPVKRHDELGRTTQVFNDMVNQLRQSREHLEQLSTTDSLTELANRRHILEKLKTQLERFRRNGTSFSVLLVDADHFKRINDRAGHLMGDQVLRRLGSIFKQQLRAVDAAGRYGGEEFLIVLDETKGKDALQTAERIRLAVESTEVTAENTNVRITVSIGVAEIKSGEDEDQLIMRADTALYQAKREGRNRSVMAASPNAKVAKHPTVRELKPS